MSEELDPRYDPRYQRGFTPPPARPVDRFEALPDDRGDLIGVPPGRTVEPERTAAAEREEPPAAEKPIPFNPWALALLIVSVTMIVIGLAVTWRAAANNGASWSSETPNFDIFVQQLLWTLPNPLITVGLVGLMLRLGLTALWAGERR